MNRAVLLGRLTFEPEVRYTQGSEPTQVTRYTLAVNKRFKREGESDADFIPCVTFGKAAEFAGKYFKKGMLVCVSGRISVRNWEDQNGQKRITTEIVVDEQDFAESKSTFESRSGSSSPAAAPSAPKEKAPQKPAAKEPTYNNSEAEGFYPIDESLDDDELPF